jgi:hypothetical protein
MRLDLSYFITKKNFLGKIANKILSLNSIPPPDWVLTPHNKSFINDVNFQNGYSTAIKNIGFDYRIPWRVHQAIWAANHCLSIDGDFVELGTGKGFIMQSVLGSFENWNTVNKKLLLFDTFLKFENSGKGKEQHNLYYASNLEEVKNNFSIWENVEFIQGDVSQEILTHCPTKISFLHVDLNDGDIEIKMLKHLFDKMSPSGIILLDDYANNGEEYSYSLHNSFFKSLRKNILTTPSGQGIVII